MYLVHLMNNAMANPEVRRIGASPEINDVLEWGFHCGIHLILLAV